MGYQWLGFLFLYDLNSLAMIFDFIARNKSEKDAKVEVRDILNVTMFQSIYFGCTLNFRKEFLIYILGFLVSEPVYQAFLDEKEYRDFALHTLLEYLIKEDDIDESLNQELGSDHINHDEVNV
jgi:hypothetical protein